MPQTLFARLRREIKGFEEDAALEAHRAVARSLARLDRLAADVGVVPLSAFISEDPDAVLDAVDDEDEAEAILAKLPPLRWFGAMEVLPTLDGLLQQLHLTPAVLGLKKPEPVFRELMDLRRTAAAARVKNVKLRLFAEFG